MYNIEVAFKEFCTWFYQMFPSYFDFLLGSTLFSHTMGCAYLDLRYMMDLRYLLTLDVLMSYFRAHNILEHLRPSPRKGL
jgi:hypothetical protein